MFDSGFRIIRQIREKRNRGYEKKGRLSSIYFERGTCDRGPYGCRIVNQRVNGVCYVSPKIYFGIIDNLAMIAFAFTSHPFAILFHVPVYTIHVPSVYLNLTIGRINPCQREFEDLLFDYSQHSLSFDAILAVPSFLFSYSYKHRSESTLCKR